MWYLRGLLSGLLAVGAAAVLSGCGFSPQPDESKATPSAADSRQSPKASNEKNPAAAAAGKDVPEGLLELSGEDRSAAEKQRICPVTGLLLGSMGKPEKVIVKGQTVFLCCAGCEEQLRKDPDTYLKKLQAAMAKD